MKTKDQALFGHLLWVEPRIVAHAAGKALTFLGTQHQLHLLLNMIRYDFSTRNCKEVSWPRVLKHSQEEDENRRCWTPRLPRDASHTFNIFWYRGGSKVTNASIESGCAKREGRLLISEKKGWSHPRIDANIQQPRTHLWGVPADLGIWVCRNQAACSSCSGSSPSVFRWN